MVWRWGKREIIYLSLRRHHQNDFCTKMGSGERHFNVSLIVRDKVTRQSPQTTTFEEKGEQKQIRNRGPSAYQPNALPLGQTGSRAYTDGGPRFIPSLIRRTGDRQTNYNCRNSSLSEPHTDSQWQPSDCNAMTVTVTVQLPRPRMLVKLPTG